MSLVNDMLKDLEAGRREPLPQGVYLDDAPARHSLVPRVLGTLGLVVFVAGAFYLGLNWRDAELSATDVALAQLDNQAVTETVDTTKIAAALRDVELNQALDPQRLTEETPVVVPVVEQSVVAQVAVEQAAVEQAIADPKVVASERVDASERIASLLHRAAIALREDRLTSPIEDNAFARYQAVLLLEPSHPEALEGIKKIAERYLEFYAIKYKANEPGAANSHLGRAERVVSRYPMLSDWFDQRRDATVAGMVATTEIDRGANSAPDQQAAANQEAAVPASVEQATIHNTSALVAQPAMPGEHQDNRQSVRVSPSKSELDKRLAERAQTLMQQQRLAEAETLLQNHLAGDPDASASRTMLVEVYLASGDLSSARQQVELLTDIPSHARARLTARIDMESGAIQSAIAGLEAARPSLPAEPGYYGFLAALYHRAERFREAADVYEQLLALNSNQATYWLGLAVSLDALNDRSGALRAFRYARLYGRPDAPSRGYVEERIQTLSG